MSKILHAVRILHDNPTATRNDLIEMLMAQLPMSKAGATTYYYNATKIIQTKEFPTKVVPAPKKADAKIKVSELVDIKKKNLETMKKVSARISKMKKQDEAVLAQHQQDMDEFSKEDPREFVPSFILKKMDQYVE